MVKCSFILKKLPEIIVRYNNWCDFKHAEKTNLCKICSPLEASGKK